MPARPRRQLGLVVGLLFVLVSAVSEGAAGSKAPVVRVARFAVFEHTLPFTTAASNPWEQVRAEVSLRSPSGRKLRIGGFYAAPGTWKFRFAPGELGAWTWAARVSDGARASSYRGGFAVVGGNSPGFVRRSPYNRFRWTFQDGAPYNPIGIQDCTLPVLSRNPLRFWGLDGGFMHGDYRRLGRWVSMDTYMRTYSAAGFDLFRWGPDNCSFSLYERIDPSGNVYSLEGGRYADQLFATLRRYGFRVEMVLFGNHPPFPSGSQNQAEMAAIERYAKYVADRYGAYVDLWELMNEASVSDGWYSKIGGYLHRIDPYHHPLGTSWSRPDLPVIDFDSDHWYGTENQFNADQIASKRLRDDHARALGKPTLVDEQGNTGQNWDPTSAVRMRLRAWTAFFTEGSLVFWNTSVAKDYRSPLSANIYLGPQERRFVQVLQSYTRGFDPRARIGSAGVAGRLDIRAYVLRGPKDYGLYLVAGLSHTVLNRRVKVVVDPLTAGRATWIDPVTGRVLGTATLGSGRRTLAVPPFTTDVALKIAARPRRGRAA